MWDYLCASRDRSEVGQQVNTGDALDVLVADDFWNRKRSMAQRVRQRIYTVTRWAVAQGYREDNPGCHALKDALEERARSDPLDRRRGVVEAWSDVVVGGEG